MARGGYLLRGRSGQINALNSEVVKATGWHLADAIRPVSSERGLMSEDAFKRVRGELGAQRHEQLLHKHGVEIVRELDDFDAIALIKTRDPADLGPRGASSVAPVKDPTTGLLLDWHLVECRFPTAWQAFGGAEAIDWTGIKVGHIDTGFTRHPALGFASDSSDSDWINTAHDRNFFAAELDTSTGTPTFVDSTSAEERDAGGLNGGHGTRTMSVLCGFDASTEARAGGYDAYLGGAPRVPVVPIRLQDSVWLQGRTFSDDLPDAINHLVDTAGVDVITLSMGGPVGSFLNSTTPDNLRRVIDKAYERGVIFCCAAGNNIPNEKVVFPARSSRTIAVAGIARNRRLWVGSSYGAQVDICAPAHGIRRADLRRSLRGLRFGYGEGEGTSFATPQVAAAAALWLARWGEEIESAYPERWQRVQAFKAALAATATLGEDWQPSVYGAGILNAAALLEVPLPEVSTLIKDISSDWS